MEASWTVGTLKISHATLGGGVINQVQEFKVATQNGEAPIEWRRQLGLDASLDQILDCKVLGNTAAAPQPGHPSGDKERLQVKKVNGYVTRSVCQVIHRMDQKKVNGQRTGKNIRRSSLACPKPDGGSLR